MKLRLGVVQMNSGEEKAANLQQALGLIDDAARQGANFVALPEYFNFLGRGELVPENAETQDGPTVQALSAAARRHNIWLHGGSIPERVEAERRHCNTTFVFDPNGNVAAKYQKIHLFDVEAGGTVYKESASVAPGDTPVVFDTPWGKMGLTICYDLRFGELHAALARAGARLIFQPAAFTLYTGKDHWEVLLRARAIENQVFVAAPAQIFKHPPGNACFGSAMVVDPWGTILSRAPERICSTVTDIDLECIDEVRGKIPVHQHRRRDVYGKL